MTVQASSPKKSPGPSSASTASLAPLDTTVTFNFAIQDVEHGIGRISLREDDLIFAILRNRSPLADTGEKSLGIEGTLPFLFACDRCSGSHRITFGLNQSSAIALRRELWTLIRPSRPYSMKPWRLNRFMKKLTRGRVVPIIFANTA
jgi:hypothetical protein